MTGPLAMANRLRTSRAVAVGVAVGVGLAVRYMTDRAVKDHDRRLVDWTQVERIATHRLRRAPGRLDAAQLRAAEPAYARAMARIVPLLEQRLGTPLPGVVERHDVVDRAEWARANLGTFQALVGHLEGHLGLDRNRNGVGAAVAVSANRFVTTRQLGFLLGFLGTRVLGQYDIALLSAEEAPGRLLFVEENIRATAHTLGVPVDQFRTWIALHEATHAFEIEAHPWVRPYIRERLERQIALFLDEARALQAGGLRGIVRRWKAVASEGSIAGFMGPEQRGLMRETQLVMSLLEGFSDWVMDDVGEGVLPDVKRIREKFEARRSARRKGIDRIVARLTGLDMKLEQYRRGERFVSGVYAAGGDAAVARLWDGPASLPTDTEMDDPAAWVRRILVDGPALALAAAPAAAEEVGWVEGPPGAEPALGAESPDARLDDPGVEPDPGPWSPA
ncbi:MAG: zinc-dependent metalloprotease [Chloroflexota bacterium]